MYSYKQFLGEGTSETINDLSGLPFRVYINPSKDFLTSFIDKTKYAEFRGLYDPDTDRLYVWDSEKEIHSIVARKLNIAFDNLMTFKATLKSTGFGFYDNTNKGYEQMLGSKTTPEFRNSSRVQKAFGNITEGKVETLPDVDIKVFTDPSLAQMKNFIPSTIHKRIRGLYDTSSDSLYVWDAAQLTHHSMIKELGLYKPFQGNIISFEVDAGDGTWRLYDSGAVQDKPKVKRAFGNLPSSTESMGF